MRILILGAGKMGSFFTDILSFQHETAVFDVNPHQLRFVYNTYRFTTLEEIKEFEPELVINAVTVKYTLDAFRKILPVLPKDCIISDIASVKTGLKKFYEESGFRIAPFGRAMFLATPVMTAGGKIEPDHHGIQGNENEDSFQAVLAPLDMKRLIHCRWKLPKDLGKATGSSRGDQQPQPHRRDQPRRIPQPFLFTVHFSA